MVGEAYIQFLTALFGAPRMVEGGLLFDVRRTGLFTASMQSERHGVIAESISLDFPEDFKRTWQPCHLRKEAPLVWELEEGQWGGLGFWAMAEAGTPGVRVRLRLRDSRGLHHVTRGVPLDYGLWQRVVLTPRELSMDATSRVEEVAIEPLNVDDGQVSISYVQLLRPLRTGSTGGGLEHAMDAGP